ncbi:MAG TPA: SoxY-related AACIE arm protein [Xanthobacteraceae bacterium]|nr:SoxY-related AACIE arm protein [Xanthobacteraceae bacterium]
MPESDRTDAATRRQFLVVAGGLAGAALTPLLGPRPAAATPAMMDAAIRDVVGEAPVREGKVTLDLPPLVENGNAVPMTVTVDSPMSAADHVKRIHVFNEKNPQPYVATFHLGPRAGKAKVSTRVRLADSQKVVAIAEMSDGSFWSDSVNMIVTLAACVEETP